MYSRVYLFRLSIVCLYIFIGVTGFNASAQKINKIDVDSLFDFAEQENPNLFSPPGAITSENVSNWLYRFYSVSRSYAGVYTGLDGAYRFGGAYVLGGDFGESIQLVDTLTNLKNRITPLVVDFRTLQSQLTTPFFNYVVSLRVASDATIQINGNTALQKDGLVSHLVEDLVVGDNVLKVVIKNDSRTEVLEQIIHVDPNFSLASRTILFVAYESEDLKGTVVLDLDNRASLGFIRDLQVRAANDEGLVLFDNGLVQSTTRWYTTTSLPLVSPIEINDVLLLSDNRVAISDEIWNLTTLSKEVDLSQSVKTAGCCGGPLLGNAAYDQRGEVIFSGVDLIYSTDLSSQTVAYTGLRSSNYRSRFIGDLLFVSPNTLCESRYNFASGNLVCFDLESEEVKFSVTNLPDFMGNLGISSNGFILAGSAGNPVIGPAGAVHVVDIHSGEIVDTYSPGRAHAFAIKKDRVFVSSSASHGVDELIIRDNGQIDLVRSYLISNASSRADIRRVVIANPSTNNVLTIR